LTIRVPRHPGRGETILGTGHSTGAGGKGANQAAAAARLGRSVAMIGAVGDDDAGRFLLDALQRDGVDTSIVIVDTESATGVAIITLSDDAENTIVVSPGANGRLGVGDVEAAREVLSRATVTLLQLEVPLAAVEAAVSAARGLVVLNPAPARLLPFELLERVDLLVPNRSELALLTDSIEATTTEEAAEQAMNLRGPKNVVVTLGSEGALLMQNGEVTRIAAPLVKPVDTTAAGDAFCGALADALARGESVADAVRWAVHAGAVAATRPGAITSLPSTGDVIALMNGEAE